MRVLVQTHPGLKVLFDKKYGISVLRDEETVAEFGRAQFGLGAIGEVKLERDDEIGV